MTTNSNLPKDPFMLLSMVNMKLRDGYDTLDSLCRDLDVEKEELTRRLRAAGFEYVETINQFR
jgi:hypothetical protein